MRFTFYHTGTTICQITKKRKERWQGTMLSRRRPREDRSVYKAIERALWAFAPVPALLLMLSYPSLEGARKQAEADQAGAAAAENHEFCTKWGMPEGTAEHLACIRDLVGIRARTEQWVRDRAATELDF